MNSSVIFKEEIAIRSEGVLLAADLVIPDRAAAVVAFAHGSGSGRHSRRNQYVAGVLQEHGFATLLLDLLSEEEEIADAYSGEYRFDIPLLADRLVSATDWLGTNPKTSHMNIGYFGASTGAAAALIAATKRESKVKAIVSRGGRPDLAGDALPLVQAPTLLLVGSNDEPVIDLNQDALARLNCQKHLLIIQGATHLFEEPGALEEVARHAGQWFHRHLIGIQPPQIQDGL
jgi:putative phosphoribosyl transferase